MLADRDVHLGNWDPEYAVFTAGGEPLNAVRTATRCATVNGNPVQLFFAGILGIMETDISAGATAIAEAGAKVAQSQAASRPVMTRPARHRLPGRHVLSIRVADFICGLL